MKAPIRLGRYSRLSSTAVLVLLGACAYQNATFGPETFEHSRYDYSVRYADPVTREIMSPEWQLDNYTPTSSGLEEKDSGFYASEYEFDTDKDRVLDASDTQATFDLRFVHKKARAVVWLRTVPGPLYESTKTVYALASYLDGIPMAGYELARFGEQITSDRQFAMQILETSAVRLAKVPALAVTIEVAKLSELEKSPMAKRMRARLVLWRTDKTQRVPATDWEYPTVSVAGYASPAEQFDKHLPDFRAFLGQIVLHGQSGYEEPGTAAKEEAR